MMKVLIVEDEYLTRRGMVEMTDWRGMGCEVIGEAANGEEGLEKIIKLKPDVVVTDIRMPKLTGIEMITEAQKYTGNINYIIVTAYGEFEYAVSAVRLGVADYLLKPFKDEDLQKVIMQIENRRNGRLNDNYIELINLPDTVFSPFVEQAIEYVASNYNEDFSIADVAESLEVSEGHLSRIFKKETSYTFFSYLRRFRVERAMVLLTTPQLKIYEISELVGYPNHTYFNTIFKKYVGMTPTEFREKIYN